MKSICEIEVKINNWKDLSKLLGSFFAKTGILMIIFSSKRILKAALDAASTKKVCQTLERLLKKKTAVIITHSKEVQSICDKVIPITKGGIL